MGAEGRDIPVVREARLFVTVDGVTWTPWDGLVTLAPGAGGLTNTELRATPVPVLATIDTTGLATSAAQLTGNASLVSIDGKTPALGQAVAAGSSPVVLPAAQIVTLTPPAAITGFGLESTQLLQATAANQATGNASLNSIDGKLTNPLPVSLPAATVIALTPPAAITGFALETTQQLQATAALQTAGNASLTTIAAAQASTLMLDGQTVSFTTDYIGRRMQEAQYLQGLMTSMNTIISSEAETSQRAGFELR